MEQTVFLVSLGLMLLAFWFTYYRFSVTSMNKKPDRFVWGVMALASLAGIFTFMGMAAIIMIPCTNSPMMFKNGTWYVLIKADDQILPKVKKNAGQ